MGYLYGHPMDAIKVFDSTPVQNNEDSRRLFSKQDALEKAWAINNLPKEYHPAPADEKLIAKDNTWRQHVEWRMACELDHTVEYVKTTPTETYMIPTEGRREFNKGGVRMADAQGKFNFRDTGILVYKAYLAEQRIRDLITSKEGEEFAEQHADLLSNAPNIDYIVIEKGKAGIYGVQRICKHSAIIHANYDSFQKMDQWAEKQGVDTDAWIRRGFLEELGHMIKGHTATVENEREVRLMLIDIYSALAEKTGDLESKGKYLKIIHSLERELATVKETYSKLYSKNASLAEMYRSDAGKLELILESEARLEYGLSEEEVTSYVASRLEEIAHACEAENARDDEADEGVSGEGGLYDGSLDGDLAYTASDTGDGTECESEEGSGDGGDTGGDACGE